MKLSNLHSFTQLKIQTEDLKSIVFIFAFLAFLYTSPLKNETKETDLNVGLKNKRSILKDKAVSLNQCLKGKEKEKEVLGGYLSISQEIY